MHTHPSDTRSPFAGGTCPQPAGSEKHTRVSFHTRTHAHPRAQTQLGTPAGLILGSAAPAWRWKESPAVLGFSPCSASAWWHRWCRGQGAAGAWGPDSREQGEDFGRASSAGRRPGPELGPRHVPSAGQSICEPTCPSEPQCTASPRPGNIFPRCISKNQIFLI